MLKKIVDKLTGRTSPHRELFWAELTADQFKQLVLDVARTQGEELACDSTHELLDEYADLMAGGQDAEEALPLVKHHMEMCPDCRDEYETLLDIIQSIEQ